MGAEVLGLLISFFLFTLCFWLIIHGIKKKRRIDQTYYEEENYHFPTSADLTGYADWIGEGHEGSLHEYIREKQQHEKTC